MKENTHYNTVKTSWGSMRILTDEGLKNLVSLLTAYHYTQWNPEIIKLRETHPDVNFKAGRKTKTLGFQAHAFITDRTWKEYGFDREQLFVIMGALVPDKKSGDVIQLFNKIDQHGIKRFVCKINRVTYYSCPTLEYSGKNHRARPSGEEGLYGEAGNREWWKELSKEEFQSGHKDPSKPLTPENTVMQPATLNRTYRDTYIFDDRGLPLFPTMTEFMNNTNKYVESNVSKEIMAIHLLRQLPEADLKRVIAELSTPDEEAVGEVE